MKKHIQIGNKWTLSLLLVAIFAIVGTSQARAANTPPTTNLFYESQVAASRAPLGKITLLTQAEATTWYRGTNRVKYSILWANASTSPLAFVNAELVPTNPASTTNVLLTPKGVQANKKKITLDVNALKKIPYGDYHIKLTLKKLTLTSKGMSVDATSTYSVTSVGVVSVVEHQDPFIAITSPSAGDSWAVGSKQKITWAANFIKGGNKADPLYSDIKFIPRYGYATSSIDTSKFNSSDKKLLSSLSPVDIEALSRLPKNKFALLSPTTVTSVIPNISDPGAQILSKISPSGFGVLKVFNPIEMTGVVNSILLKPVTMLLEMDPLSKALFSGFGLGGSSAPPEVHATVYLVPVDGMTTGETLIKLDKTTIENIKDTVTIPKTVTPGKYKIKIDAVLKNTSVSGYSPVFTITSAK